MSNFIHKVISGLQTGADQGGLAAARKCGIETGGHAVKGFLTETGPRADLGELYKLLDLPTTQYPVRTGRNAFNSDGTIRFAMDWNSPGELLTFEICKELNKPIFDVSLRLEQYAEPMKLDARLRLDAAFGPHLEANHSPFEVCGWIWEHDIRTLNVAGNRESTCKTRSIETFVTNYLVEVFEMLKG
jgi:hypothetical protein